MKKLKALIVDDEPGIRKLMRIFLDNTGLFSTIAEAEDGAHALKKIFFQDYNLYIIDLQMPNKLGLEVVTSLQQMMEKRKVPYGVILFSGNLSTQDVRKAMALGLKHILAKPFSEERFEKKLQEILLDELKSFQD